MAKKTAGSGPPIIIAEPVAAQPVLAYPERTRDKCAIVGFAEGHRHLAPFKDDTWEIWGLNRLHMVQEGRWNRWFEIHDLQANYKDDPQHREWMRQCPIPIYIRPQDMGVYDIPNAQPFPLALLLRDFTVEGRTAYLTNSISYMIGMAIGMGFTEIGLWGVDMAQDGLIVTGAEYRMQRPSCEYYLGIAHGRGIKVTLPPGSDLLMSSHMYGMEEQDPIVGKRLSRMEELGRRKQPLRDMLAKLEADKQAQESSYWQQRIALTAQINQLDGAQQEVSYSLSQLGPPTEQVHTVNLK